MTIYLPCYEIRRVGDGVRPNTDMSLFNKFYCLIEFLWVRKERKWAKMTYGADSFGHLGHAHEDCEAASAKGGYGDLVFDVAEFCGGAEDAHVVELGEHLGLHAQTDWVVRGQQRQAMCERLERSRELVVSEHTRARLSHVLRARSTRGTHL